MKIEYCDICGKPLMNEAFTRYKLKETEEFFCADGERKEINDG